MRVAALYDIHANLPALEAALAEVREARVDRIVVGGDVLPGQMPRETLARLLALDIPVKVIVGNGDLAVLAQIGVTDPNDVTYLGTTSGAPLPEPIERCCGGRRSRFILTTIACCATGLQLSVSRLTG
jgi:predicted phosphodiesterase